AQDRGRRVRKSRYSAFGWKRGIARSHTQAGERGRSRGILRAGELDFSDRLGGKPPFDQDAQAERSGKDPARSVEVGSRKSTTSSGAARGVLPFRLVDSWCPAA